MNKTIGQKGLDVAQSVDSAPEMTSVMHMWIRYATSLLLVSEQGKTTSTNGFFLGPS